MKEYFDYKYRLRWKFKFFLKKVDCYLFILFCLLIIDELFKCVFLGMFIIFFVMDLYFYNIFKGWLFLFVLLVYMFDLSVDYFII